MTQLDKSDVLNGLFASWDAIDYVIGDLPDSQWSQQTSLPGWSVHDVVAHVIGTESMLQGAAMPDADIDVSTLKHVRNDIGVMNERWVRKLRGHSNSELLDRFRTTTAERRDELTAMREAQWTGSPRPRPGRTATGASCGYGSSTAGCTNTTSAKR